MASQTYNLNTWAAKRVIGDSAAQDAASALLQTGEYNLDNTWIFNRTNHLPDLYGIRYLCDTETTAGEGEDPIIETTGQDKIELYGGYQVDNTDTPTAWVRLDTGVIHLNNRNDWSNPPAFEIMCASKLFQIKPSNQGEGIDIGYDWDNYDGAGISFRAKDSTNYPGQFNIWARRDSSHSYTLKGESGGQLTWTGYFTANQNIAIRRNNKDKVLVFQQYGTGATVGTVNYDSGNATNVTSGRFSFNEFSPKSTADGNTTGYAEIYYLPSCTVGLTANAAYNILTSKDMSFSITGNAATATALSTSGTAAKFWRGDNAWSDTISGGTLKITANSNTVTIGSQNATWCHFTNSASINFYFNHQIHAVDGFVVYNTNTKLTNNSLAFAQGGGWSMSDSTWIRTVGSKSVYMNTGTFRCDGTIQAGSSGSYTWTSGGVLTTSRIIATSTTDAVPGSVAAVALITGSSTGAHTEMDNNEIITKTNASTKSSFYINESCEITSGGLVKNAVWNDYAEYRRAETIEPGYCVATQEDGIMYKTNERLYRGAHVISDTYGHAIGMSDTAKTPIAIAGRVLVHPYQDRNNYHIGDCVCATYDGKVDIMTREEIKEYPDRIVGIVDEIPTYEIWNETYTFYKSGSETTSQTPVNGRIWIYVK